jgi:enoyl-CoA hydratase/carnithine racemase
MSNNDDLSVAMGNHVATITLRRPPHNFIDPVLVGLLADRLSALDTDPDCRVVVLRAEGRSFCAGADFSTTVAGGAVPESAWIYREAMRLFRNTKPIIAAIHGPAIGAGVGLALAADFRIAATAARFAVNFNRLGIHPGFGLSFTLPQVVGEQHAARLFYTGQRIDAAEALRIKLVDEVVPDDILFEHVAAFAAEIARSAPDAVQSTRATLRSGFADHVCAASDRELQIQIEQFKMSDFREGIAAASERRQPAFNGF